MAHCEKIPCQIYSKCAEGSEVAKTIKSLGNWAQQTYPKGLVLGAVESPSLDLKWQDEGANLS